MDPSSFGTFQHQLRQNQQELQDYMKDLDSWKTDISKKDQKLKTGTPLNEEKTLPPVRNSLHKKKKVKKPKHLDRKSQKEKPQALRGSDFRAWDKYDVDAELAKVDDEHSNSSYEEETDEEWEEERLKQQALFEKEQGNEYFKKKEYERAVNCYTSGLQCDAANAILYANRAMALIKLERYGAAEQDCTDSLVLDPAYVKAYMRRASCREKLDKLEAALSDFRQIVKLEPENKTASRDVTRLEQKLRLSSEGLVLPIRKPREKRSQAPLKRIKIEEIDDSSVTEKLKQAISATTAKQGSEKKRLQGIDNQEFAKFTSKSSGEVQTASSTRTRPVQSFGDKRTDPDSKSTPAQSSFMSPADIGRISLDGASGDTQSDKPSLRTSPRQSTSPRQQGSPRQPQTSYQFAKDWKSVSKDKEAAYQYIKEIPALSYPALFGQSLEPATLLSILHLFKDFFVRDRIDVSEHLIQLSNVKRFGMNIMLMLEKDKAVVYDLMRSLTADFNVSPERLQQIKTSYELR